MIDQAMLVQRSKLANAAGIDNLQNGKHVEAFNNFTTALRLVKAVLYHFEAQRAVYSFSSSQYQHGMEESDNVKSRRERSGHSPMHGDDNLDGSDNILTSDHEERDAPLVVPVNLQSDQSSHCLYMVPLGIAEEGNFSSRADVVQLSVAILFNLALAHHAQALGHKGNPGLRHAMLQQAKELYEATETVLMDEQRNCVGIEATMGMINNLGHIHSEIGNEEEASRRFNQLLTTLVLVQSHDERQAQNPRNELFVRSTSHLILKGIVAAAA